MNEHQTQVAVRMLKRAKQELVSWKRTFVWAEDTNNLQQQERARLGVIKYQEKIAKLQKKLSNAGSKEDAMLKTVKLSPAFVAMNGATWEVHQREHDHDGRQWDRTTAGPFAREVDAYAAADQINYIYYL